MWKLVPIQNNSRYKALVLMEWAGFRLFGKSISYTDGNIAFWGADYDEKYKILTSSDGKSPFLPPLTPL